MIKGPVAEKVGFVLARVLVPIWILTGATFKLIAQTPSTLPKFTIFDPAAKMEIDLGILLNVLIGLEFLAIGVIIFMPRLARLMAGFMLGSFVLILTNELIQGADSCGCFGGKISIHPGVMMGIDGALLLGVILFPLPKGENVKLMQGYPRAAILTVLGFAISFGVMGMTQKRGTAPIPNANNSNPGQTIPADPCAAPPQQLAFKNYWYVEGEINDWVGQCWNQIDMFKYMRDFPDDIAQGEKLIVLFRLDCDHCEAMFMRDFRGTIEIPIYAYQIPVESPTWELPPDHTALIYELSSEMEWIITSPLVVKLVDGKVECAAEGEGFEPCLGVPPYDH